MARLSEQRCEVCGSIAVRWRVRIGGQARYLCAECTRRQLVRFAPDASASVAEMLRQMSAETPWTGGVRACPHCSQEPSRIAQQGVAGCADCYRLFPQAVDEWLTQWLLPARHGGEPLPDVAQMPVNRSLSAQPSASWLDALQQPQIIISSRARYARNFVWARFPWCADSAEMEEVSRRVERFARASKWRFDILPTARMKPSERQRWVDLRLASPHLRQNTLYGPLIVDETRTVSMLINEEDHLRVQAVLPGLQVRESIALARGALESLALQEELAFSDNYGWLTTSILNIGWGLRISVMMHTPALERSGQLQTVWDAAMELGATIRGLYGEGTPVSALFQVSNVHSIGLDEATIAAQVSGTARFIAQAEQRTREELLGQHAEQLRKEAEQVYHNLGRERNLRAADALQMLSTISLASAAGWGNLSAEIWKQMLMAVRWEAPHDDAEWRAIRMRTLVRQVRHG